MTKIIQKQNNLSYSEPLFQIQCPLGKTIRTTKPYWKIIINIKHPSVAGKVEDVKSTISSPDVIHQSKVDKDVYLYYKKQKQKHLSVVVRQLNGDGFIITSYYTDKIKEGKLIWKKE